MHFFVKNEFPSLDIKQMGAFNEYKPESNVIYSIFWL